MSLPGLAKGLPKIIMKVDMNEMINPSVSVILPCFNEEKTVGKVVADIGNRYPEYEIIVVDDGSNDETFQVAKDFGAKVFRHPYNIGNGAAVKTGIRCAGGDIMVFMDADGQHDPKDIAAMVSALRDYDMVVGSRTKKQQASLFRGVGNALCNIFASYVAKFTIRDLTSGFRAVRSETARNFLYLLPNKYSYPTTSTLYVLRTGRSLAYVNIDVRKRESGKSNIRIVRDGIRFFLIIVKICILYSPFRVFLPVSVVFFVLGFIRYLYTFITANQFTNMSALLMSTGILVFLMGLVSEQICQVSYENSESGCPR